MTMVVIWVAMAMLAYKLAESKGRDPWVAFAFTLLFGVFALIVYLLIPPTEGKQIERARSLLGQNN